MGSRAGAQQGSKQLEVTEILHRVWTDRKNRQVNAKFIGRFGDVIKVEKYDGGLASFTYQELSDGDQEYVDAVVRKFGSSPGARTWSDTTGKNFRASFVRLNRSELEFMLIDEERKISIETLFLSKQDIEYILDRLNRSVPRNGLRYRVWSYLDSQGNELRSIGQYKRLSGDKVVLTQMDGFQMIELSRLRKPDLTYIETVDPTVEKTIAQFQKALSENEGAPENSAKQESETPQISPIWWISLGLVFLLMLGLISIKYIYESGEPEFDDEI